MSNPPLLIESWLPIEEIGAESKRERGASSALPPLYFLHVWWARRPLIASRAAILASVLPQWTPDWPEELQRRFPNQDTYHQWFIHLLGIRGDPVQGRKLAEMAKARGIRLDFNPYGDSPRAFTINPSKEDLLLLSDLIEYTWGSTTITVLDTFAGGGSIPFESIRFGFDTTANELNSVATVILKATLDYPIRFGLSLADEIRKWGKIAIEMASSELSEYYPMEEHERIRRYLWARTISCPTTGKLVPLSPNWWLKRGENAIAIELITTEKSKTPDFRIVSGQELETINPNEGTVKRGIGKSPWTGEIIDGEYIKSEAQAGRMGEILYAINAQTDRGYIYRNPTNRDLKGYEKALNYYNSMKQQWMVNELIPNERIPRGNKTAEPLRYGIYTWADMFSKRQLVGLIVYIQVLKEIEKLMLQEMDSKRVKAIILYLAFSVSKLVNYNSKLSLWHSHRETMVGVFNRHDFAFAWSFGEITLPNDGFVWALNQIVDSYQGIAKLVNQDNGKLFKSNIVKEPKIIQGSANNLKEINDGSIQNITVDPPYYDNVQYAELSDLFFVWLKRSIGHLFPNFFKESLTNKDEEAVANPARFEDLGKKKKELAETDYKLKMTSAFKEMNRVLNTNGVLTVMFTHKRVEAWDTLASALIGAGFTIKSSWPIHTESEHALNQAKKNAAASTILLACRKREKSDLTEPNWWDDIQGKVRDAAREKAQEFSDRGISGVDLYISTFGPTLSIISENWPVLTSEVDPKTGQPKPLRPEIALNLAREEVIRLRRQGLLLGHDVQFDQPTDWYLMAWDAFAAEQFPYDEARKLAIVLDVDLDKTIKGSKRMLRKKGKFVILQKPVERRKKGMVDEEVDSFEHWIDAAHTAMMIYEEDGAGACDFFLRKTGLKNDTTYKALLQAMINAIPRTRIKGKFIRPEAEVLENMRLAFYDDLEVPVEEEPELPGASQLDLF